jgi:hypothetical protein
VPRSQGQHKSEFDRAKEALEKQEALVERLRTKELQLVTELNSIQDQLVVAKELLEYYQSHPVLQVKDRTSRDASSQAFEDVPLPIEDNPQSTWKGFTERHLQGQ